MGAQSQLLRSPHKLPGLGHGERNVLAETVDRVHQTRCGQLVEPRSAHFIHEPLAMPGEFGRQGVQAKK